MDVSSMPINRNFDYNLCEKQILLKSWLFTNNNNNKSCEEWKRQWIVIHTYYNRILLSSFKYANIYVNPIHSVVLSSDFELFCYKSIDNKHHSFSIQLDDNNIFSYGSPSYGIQQQWIKQLTQIRQIQQLPQIDEHKANTVHMNHRLFFMKHIITRYLLPYEQYKIASINKAIYKCVCKSSIYNTAQFIRDAMYWNQYYFQNISYGVLQRRYSYQSRHSLNKARKFDFTDALKSMEIKDLMQLKYFVIHIQKINEFISTKSKNLQLQIALNSNPSTQKSLTAQIVNFTDNPSSPICMNTLDFSSFIKPKMLMMECYSYSSEESDDDEDDYLQETDYKTDHEPIIELDRLKYICDILQFTDFGSSYNTIKDIGLTDNSLNIDDLSKLLSAIQQNQVCMQFKNIKTLNLSQNLFITSIEDDDDSENIEYFKSVMFRLFHLIGTRFPNLTKLDLSETGVTNIIFDAIIDFQEKYPYHPLEYINLKRCDDLNITDAQYNQINPSISHISILYDDHKIDSKQLYDEEFEFGFDCNFIDDSDDDEQDDMKEQQTPSFGFEKTKSDDIHMDSNEAEQALYFDPQQQSVSSQYTDDDGFVYMDDEYNDEFNQVINHQYDDDVDVDNMLLMENNESNDAELESADTNDTDIDIEIELDLEMNMNDHEESDTDIDDIDLDIAMKPPLSPSPKPSGNTLLLYGQYRI